MYARLRQVLLPPKAPHERPSEEEWKAVEDKWCLLPKDFKSFVTQYGTGVIDGFIWLFNPASKNPNLNLAEQINSQLEALRASSPEELKIFPEDNGVLPFGITDNGDLVAWVTQGDPSAWGVVVIDSRAPTYEEFDLSMSEFIAKILTKEIRCSIFPKDFPSSSPTFGQL